MTIEYTTDYSRFRLYKSNRSIQENQELEKSILERNMLAMNPIIVDKNGYVIDGQHRLSIAKKHRLPVYFIVNEEGQETDIPLLNCCQKNWKLPDYLHHYVERGVDDYIFLQKLLEKYPIKLTTLINCFGTSVKDARTTHMYKTGKMKFKYARYYIEAICNNITEIYKQIPASAKITRIKQLELALVTLVSHPKYRQTEMLRKMEMHPDGLIEAVKYANQQNILDTLLSQVYNRFKRSNQKLKL